MKAAVIYWSQSGNTEKVARAIKDGLEAAGADVLLKRTEDAGDFDFFDYDLVCAGFPTHQWHPAKPAKDFFLEKFRECRKRGCVKTGAPKVPGKHALIFCTFSGPHTGINEAIPAGKYMGQLFEHLGFALVDELYVVGEFHGSEERSTLGRMGNIKGRPNQEDLEKVRQDVARLVQRIQRAAKEEE